MKVKLQKKLFMKYPQFFIKKDYRFPRLSILKTKLRIILGICKIQLPCLSESLMGFGFECGDGWYNLLDNLFREMKRSKPSPRLIINQVKEKYGTLRVYGYDFNKRIEKLIDQAEDLSAITCERCGAYGKLYTEGWCVTLCPKCKKDRDEGRR
jgi:hypothetical protein